LDSKLFEGLKNLTDLDLSRNQLAHLDSKLFEGLTSLTELNLSFNELAHLDSKLFGLLIAVDDCFIQREALNKK
jgi:Leucine-rich repeat (LRR) protein